MELAKLNRAQLAKILKGKDVPEDICQSLLGKS